MVLNSNILPYVIFVAAFFMVEIFCNEPGKNQNPWQINNAKNGGNIQVLQTNKSTTPWPTLNQRRNESYMPSNVRQQPMWLQNGSNWIRNSPISSQNYNQNTSRHTLIMPDTNSGNSRQNNQNKIINTSNMMNSYNNHAQYSPFRFVTSPKTPYNNRNNVNVHFINNERTNIPGASRVVANQNTGINLYNGNRESFSSEPLRGSQDNSTYNSQSSKDYSSGDVDDNELREFSEVLLTKDTNNAAKYVTVNLQKMTTSRSTTDEAPLPLLTIDQAALSIPSISKMLQLHNNYILETNQNEVYTAQEKLEENDFLDTILPTSVMQYTRNFLIEKGKIGKDPKEFKDLLREIWFNMYSRGGGRIGSSGFEHIFVAEIKHGQVSGLHNWIYFNEEEKKNAANYLGYMKKIDLGGKGVILKYHFVFHDKDKPVGSMFIGTSPEFEIALYTTCFLIRADRICPLKLNGNRFIIRTYTYRYRGKNMIGSAFPEI